MLQPRAGAFSRRESRGGLSAQARWARPCGWPEAQPRAERGGSTACRSPGFRGGSFHPAGVKGRHFYNLNYF